MIEDDTLDDAGVPGSSAEAGLRPGAPLGRYVVLETLGAGGMGVVYGAYDPELDRRVAVKLLHDDPVSLQGSSGRSRLLREAQALARLSHPNVVAVHDAGTQGSRVFVAMEFIQGETLREWGQAAPRSVEEILDVFVHAGRGLAAAHAAGLIHRDFKPENVMIGSDGRVRVMDFGLARAATEAASRASTAAAVPSLTSSGQGLDRPLTVTGAIMGTPAYMAPEQHLGRAVTPATDQFAFCVALYETLYGHRPFEGAHHAAVAVNVIEGSVRAPPAASSVPAWLREVILRGLRREPAERWPSMDTLIAELQPTPRRRGGRVIWIGGSMGILALGALAWPEQESPSRCTDGEARIAETWNESRRAAVSDAFQATGLPLANATWPVLEELLDARALAWANGYREACEDTHLRHEQSEQLLDLRMSCLRRHRAAMDGLIDVLASADEAVVRNALESVRKLGDVERCADRTWLLATVPPPDDPEMAMAVEAIRLELAHGDAARERADANDALELAEQALDSAKQLGYAPVVAEAALQVGELQARLGRDTEAASTLMRAWWTAISAGHDEVAIAAATAMVRLHSRELEVATRWAKDAWAFASRHDPGDRMRAALLAAEARAHLIANELEKAEELVRSAIAIYERVAPGEPGLAGARIRLAEIARERGRFKEALVEYEQARALLIASVGEDHPDVSELYLRTAGLLGFLGRPDEGLQHLTLAAEGTERAFGPDHLRMARVLGTAANTLTMMARFDEALEHHRRAYAILVATPGHDQMAVAQALANWGVTLDFAGRYAESRDKHQRALEIIEAAPRPDMRFMAGQLGNLGSALQGLGEYEHAIELHERAVPIWEAHVGENHPDVGIALRDLSRALIGAGRAEEAVVLLERAVALFSEAEVDPLELGETRYFLGQALVERRTTHERGVVQLDQARVIFEDAGERGLARLDALERWTNDRPRR